MLYVFVMGWPASRQLRIKNLAAGSAHYPGVVDRVELLGSSEPLPFTREQDAMTIALPEKAPNAYASVFKITPKG